MHAWHMDLAVLGRCAHIEQLRAGVGLKDGLEFGWSDGRHGERISFIYVSLYID